MSKKKIFTGAAIGTLLGSLAVALSPRRRGILDAFRNDEGFTDRAGEYARSLYSKGRNLAGLESEERNHAYWKGSIAGVLVAAGIGLFLAQKNNKQLRNRLSRAYHDIFGQTNEWIHSVKHNGHPFHLFNNKKPAKKSRKLSRAR